MFLLTRYFKPNSICSSFFAECPLLINDTLSVKPANGSREYNISGKLVCNNGGALFANNAPISDEIKCNKIAQWNVHNDVDCYTGMETMF